MAELQTRLLRSLPDVERRGPNMTERRVRAACRYRDVTKVVPEGRLVRHPRCPLCGERLAYRTVGDRALYLHVGDAQFRVTAVP
jgi:hypothetical protein